MPNKGPLPVARTPIGIVPWRPPLLYLSTTRTSSSFVCCWRNHPGLTIELATTMPFGYLVVGARAAEVVVIGSMVFQASEFKSLLFWNGRARSVLAARLTDRRSRRLSFVRHEDTSRAYVYTYNISFRVDMYTRD